MAVAVDVSSPARVSASAATVETAAFTPPAGSVLVACIAIDSFADAGNGVDMDGGTGFGDWTGVVPELSGAGGRAGIAWKVAAAGSQTVSVEITGSPAPLQLSLKVFVLTGVAPGGVAATQLDDGSSGTDDLIVGPFATTVDALLLVSAMDFGNEGLPSSSDLTVDVADLSAMDVLAGYKTATSVSTTANIVAGDANPAWRWIAWEFPAAPPATGHIQVDPASPARVTAVSGDNVTTAAFDAPAASVLVAAISADSDDADTYSGAVTDSAAGTWTEVVPDNSALLQSGQDGYVGMFWRTVGAAAADLTVTAEVASDNTLGITDTAPSLKVYALTGVDLDHLGSAQVIDAAATFNSTAVTPTNALTPGNLLVLAATDWADLGAPTSNTAGMVTDAFDAAGLSGLSAYLAVGDPPPATINVNAAGTDPAAWRILATEFAPRTVASLLDDFEAGVISDPPWSNSFNGAAVVDGGLELPTVVAYSGVETEIGGYTLTGSFVFVDLTEVPLASAVSQAGDGTGQAFLELADADSVAPVGAIRIGWQDDELRGTVITAGPAFTDHVAIAYSATTHRYLGIREDGAGSITFESSTDGATWTVRGTVDVATDLDFGIDNLNVRLVSGEFGETTPSGGEARFETINVLAGIQPASVAVPLTVGVPTLIDALVVQPLSVAIPLTVGIPTLFQPVIEPVSVSIPLTVGTPTLFQAIISPASVAVPLTVGLPTLIAGGLEERQLAWRGLVMGEGTPYIIRTLSGLLDRPELRTSDQPRAQRHGLFPGVDYLGGRTVEGEIVVTGDTVAAYRTNLAALQAAVAEIGPERPLRVRYPTLADGGTRQSSARVRRYAVPTLYPGAAETRIRWDAVDPRLYDSTEQTLLTSPAVGVAVDASSPERVIAGIGEPAVTTEVFDPPASLLVACVSAAATASTAVTITNGGDPLDWFPLWQRQPGDASAQQGYAGLHLAQLAAPRTGMTVTATMFNEAGTEPSVKLYVLTGAVGGTVPAAIGGNLEGSSTDQVTATAPIATTPGVGNLGVLVATDASAAFGLPTSSDTVEDAFDTTAIAGLSGVKPITESATDFAVTTAGAAPELNYAVAEIKAVALTGGTVTATNTGSISTPWRLRITGPCTDPTVSRTDQQGVYLSFAIELLAGEVLDVDVDQRTVLRDGLNVYWSRTADSTWFELAPGDTPLRFTATSSGSGAQAVITFRSAWLS